MAGNYWCLKNMLKILKIVKPKIALNICDFDKMRDYEKYKNYQN